MDDTLPEAGIVLFSSAALGLLGFPGGLAKASGNWLFLHADLTALCISMAVLIFRVTVGPTFWKKVEVRAWFAVRVALVAMVIAINQFTLIVEVEGDYWWLRFFLNWKTIWSVVVPYVWNRL